MAPAVMKAIVNTVLAKNKPIHQATSVYIDNIYINEDVVSAACVRPILSDFGVTGKDLGRSENNTRVFSLNVWWEHDMIYWKRRSEIPKVTESVTRRIIFSLCDGKLIGHYPFVLIGNFRILQNVDGSLA